MPRNAEEQLVRYLTEAHAMEKQALALLKKGQDIAGDDEIAAIYRAHHLQTEEHERYISERLRAHSADPSKLADFAFVAGAFGIGAVAQAAPDTPVRLATTAFAFEHLEIAVYQLILRLARRAGDDGTVQVAQRILEQEQAAAELVAGTFDRALELTLGEPAISPLPPVTPLGKPSERGDISDEHQGPQQYKDQPPDEPIGEPPDISTPTEKDEHLSSPDPGHPAGSTKPYRGETPGPTHPERVG